MNRLPSPDAVIASALAILTNAVHHELRSAEEAIARPWTYPASLRLDRALWHFEAAHGRDGR